ncbi:glycosyltransferase 6 domain-containing protein 1-like [Pongo abelii]|uniref:glycosyltransferase 6 domain-containing protein 1-like n=1 Tax=Pongo abelii TaxID=9601 RepID=UPI003006D43C
MEPKFITIASKHSMSCNREQEHSHIHFALWTVYFSFGRNSVLHWSLIQHMMTYYRIVPQPFRKLVSESALKLRLLLAVPLSTRPAAPEQRGTQKRPDVVTRTDWLALVIWEGTYNRQALEIRYKRLNITIGLTVFAAGK